MRKESKPGRKPASASLPQAVPASLPVPAPVRQEALLSRFPAPVPAPAPIPAAAPQAVVDNSGMEKELAAIRGYLSSIADSLKLLVSAAESSASPAAAPAPAEAPAAVPAAVTEASVPTVAKDQIGAAVPLPELREGSSGSEKPGHRRLQSMPKVWGQRGRRPE